MCLVSLPIGIDSHHEWIRLAESMSIREAAARAFRRSPARGLLSRRRFRSAVAFGSTKVKLAITRTGMPERTASPGKAWTSPDLMNSLRWAARSGVSIRFVYGDEDEFFHDFTEARSSSDLDEILTSGSFDVDIVPGEVHRLLRLEAQDAVLKRITAWAAHLGTLQLTPEGIEGVR
jgi:hypothetical protein